MTASPPNSHTPENFKRSLTLRFAGLLFLFVALLGSTYVAVSTAVNAKEYDSLVVNLAGRQRMLIQKYGREINQALVGLAVSDSEMVLEMKKHASRTAELYESTHKAFLSGGWVETEEQGRVEIPAIQEAVIIMHLGHVEAEWNELRGDMVQAQHSDIPALKRNSLVARIHEQTTKTVAEMDHAVTLLQEDSEAKLRRVRAYLATACIFGIILFLAIMAFVRARIVAPLDHSMTALQAEITERKHAEEGARTAQEQLLEQQRSETERVQAELEKARGQLVTQIRLASIGQVAGSIAHDLRNPLGSARNAIFYIKRYVPGADPDLIEHLDIINEEINTADGIISDLMNMTRSKPLVRQELDFGEVVQSAVQRAKLADGVCCRVTLDPDPFTLEADPGQLRQVVQNLLSNAAQALNGEGQITVEAKRGKDCSEIEVRDNGCGVAAEHRDRLFEPLFTTKAKGTGLGLTICREIIERHGGSIELVDRDEPGASFRVRLPCQRTTNPLRPGGS